MKKTYIFRAIFYSAGLLLLALGLTLNTKANLGVSAVISVSYSISDLFGINFGNTTLVLYCLFILIEIFLHMLHHKGNMIITDLLQFPLSLIFTRFINLFSDVIPDFSDMCNDTLIGNLAGRIMIVLLAVLLTGIGAAMSLNVRLIPNPADGVVQVIADTSGKGVGFVKNIFDLCNISFTILISLVVKSHLVGIGIGTVLSVVGVGRVIALFNHFFFKSMKDLAGISE